MLGELVFGYSPSRKFLGMEDVVTKGRDILNLAPLVGDPVAVFWIEPANEATFGRNDDRWV